MGMVIEMGSIVLVVGTIKGMGREADCEVLARKEDLPATANRGKWTYEYSQCSVLKAPSDLPDGAYAVMTSDGQTFSTNKHGGLCLPGPAGTLGDAGLQKPA